MKEDEVIQKWREHIRVWRASGETLASYSRNQGIKDHQLWYWKNKLEPKEATSKFVAIGSTVTVKDTMELTIRGVTVKLPVTLPAEKLVSIVRCLAQ